MYRLQNLHYWVHGYWSNIWYCISRWCVRCIKVPQYILTYQDVTQRNLRTASCSWMEKFGLYIFSCQVMVIVDLIHDFHLSLGYKALIGVFNMTESGPELPVLPEYRWTGGVLYCVMNHSASSILRTASSIQFTAVIPTQDIVIFLEECSHRAPFCFGESLWRLSPAWQCDGGLWYEDPVGSFNEVPVS